MCVRKRLGNSAVGKQPELSSHIPAAPQLLADMHQTFAVAAELLFTSRAQVTFIMDEGHGMKLTQELQELVGA